MVWSDHIDKEYQEYPTVSSNGHGTTAGLGSELEIGICFGN